MRVFTYHTSGGKDLILEYLDSLPNDESALGYAIIDRLSKYGKRSYLKFKQPKKG